MYPEVVSIPDGVPVRVNPIWDKVKLYLRVRSLPGTPSSALIWVRVRVGLTLSLPLRL